VYSKLPGEIEEDRGSQRLLESSSFFCVIGPKANVEFDAACDRRFDLYDDLLDWLVENPDASIYDYDPTQRDVRTSSNDLTHIRYEIQHGWGTESRRKQLSDLRRCRQDLANFQELLPTELLDRVYEQLPENEDLANALEGLGLGHDKEIVVEAVEICRKGGINTLVAIDSDLIEEGQAESINQTIQNLEGAALILEITSPTDIN
jgi:hypothetical protein